jgi:CRP-like cAMP-binding protein
MGLLENLLSSNDVESSSEIRGAMRRVSQAALPTIIADEEFLRENEFPSVSIKLKNMLLSVRGKDHGRHLGNDNDEEAVRERPNAFRTLSSVPPFSYLPESERRDLVLHMRLFNFSDGDVIIQQGKYDRDVFVTTVGRVMLVVFKDHSVVKKSSSSSPFKFLGYLDAPAVFGEYEPLFEMARMAQVVAGGNVTAYRMSGDKFLQLLSHRAFKLKIALGMRNHGVFGNISSFVAVVRRATALDKQMDFEAMLEGYRRMVPAIHAKLHSSSLDIEGWTYAIRRLPDTVTSTYVYLLSNSVPMPFMHENFDLAEISVPSDARRRLAFAVDHGKLLVVMREKFSDVLDFLSLLCAHVHESTKLRLKINKPAAFDAIHGCLWSEKRRVEGATSVAAARGKLRFYRRTMYTPAPIEEQAVALASLPLDDNEICGLKTLFPHDFLYRIWDMVAMHENIQVRADFSASYVEASDRWAESIRSAAIQLLGQRNGGDADGKQMCVSTDVTTHIISSNTTSVRNLLSPYIRKHAADIHKWGIESHPEIEKEDGLSKSDKLCALCTAYMGAHPHARQEQDEFDAFCIKTLRHTELTGIQVELIDLDSLCGAFLEHDIDADPYLAPFIGKTKRAHSNRSRRRRLLVNIDYAFGKQAEQIISALSLLFGESVASVGVMGKAGGLQGKRGDIVVAEYLVHQDGDEMTLIDNHGVDKGALSRLSQRTVWSGGVLTVLGTLLQDRMLLHYYKKLMGCVSLEMEGSFYARELIRFKKAGLMSEDMHMRFLYYFSDTPLSTDQSETLSKDLCLSEVIPPQYAVTRELLRLVLIDDR